MRDFIDFIFPSLSTRNRIVLKFKRKKRARLKLGFTANYPRIFKIAKCEAKVTRSKQLIPKHRKLINPLEWNLSRSLLPSVCINDTENTVSSVKHAKSIDWNPLVTQIKWAHGVHGTRML